MTQPAPRWTPWVGVDFDNTLSTMERYEPGVTGRPIAPMVELVKNWLAEGYEMLHGGRTHDIRIFSARVAGESIYPLEVALNRGAIQAWCAEYLGQILPITAEKGFGCIAIYDDIAHGVEPGTGVVLS